MIKCQFFSLIPVYRVYLRRQQIGGACPYCVGSVPLPGYCEIDEWNRMKSTIRKAEISQDFAAILSRLGAMVPEGMTFPSACSTCGRVFSDSAIYQAQVKVVYENSAGERFTEEELPVGALYYGGTQYIDWNSNEKALYCKTPGGIWDIDARASNCTKPMDLDHRCWVKTGDPTDPQGEKTGTPFTVGKGGNTCNAGAGSIICGSYHGFLQNGHLT